MKNETPYEEMTFEGGSDDPNYSIPLGPTWRKPMAEPVKKRRARVPRNEKIAANEKQIARYEQRIAELNAENDGLRRAARDEAARILAEAGVE